MFNIGPGELALILVAALIVLGPKRLPELARQLGKFMRDFRRQTDDVRNMVEREFYKMDQDLERKEQLPPGAPQNSIAPPAMPAVPVPSMTDPGHDEFGRLIAPVPPAIAAPAPAPPEAAPKPPNGEAPADLKPGGQ